MEGESRKWRGRQNAKERREEDRREGRGKEDIHVDKDTETGRRKMRIEKHKLRKRHGKGRGS